MANILDRYGIKEVCDVTFYTINANGGKGTPVLYLPTLKVSTMEQTAESTDAKGGKGNPPLMTWDYGREFNVTLEDALFSAKSMAMSYGTAKVGESAGAITATIDVHNWSSVPSTVEAYGSEFALTSSNTVYYSSTSSSTTFASNSFDYAILTIPSANIGSVKTIEISSNTYPGTYYVVGTTYARSEATGKDEIFMLEFPKAKILSESTLTMEAEGDPSTFNMNLRLLKPINGPTVKLTQFALVSGE